MDSFRGQPSITTKEKRLESKVIGLLIEKNPAATGARFSKRLVFIVKPAQTRRWAGT